MDQFPFLSVTNIVLTSKVDYEEVDLCILGHLLKNVENIELYYNTPKFGFEQFIRALGDSLEVRTKFLKINLSYESLIELKDEFWPVEILRNNYLYFNDLFPFEVEMTSEDFNSITFYDFGDFDKTIGLSCLVFKVDVVYVSNDAAMHLQEFANIVRNRFDSVA